MSQQGGVYHEQGTGNAIVPSGAKIIVEVGGTIESGGDAFTAVEFDSDYFEVSKGTVTLKSDVADLLEIISNIPTSDPADDGASVWLDEKTGLLKVSGPSGGG